MVMDTEQRARESDALREQEGSHMQPSGEPDATSMGAETAAYTEPSIDPQWMDAWKMFMDEKGEYGVACKLPRGQWDVGGPNALNRQRRPDGGLWFRAATPERTQRDAQYPCFVGLCKKKLHYRRQVVTHVRGFHPEAAITHRVILERIEQQIAHEDPRLQELIASLDIDLETAAAGTVPVASIDNLSVAEVNEAAEGVQEGASDITLEAPEAVGCGECGSSAPEDHADPAQWLVNHSRAAHPGD